MHEASREEATEEEEENTKYMQFFAHMARFEITTRSIIAHVIHIPSSHTYTHIHIHLLSIQHSNDNKHCIHAKQIYTLETTSCFPLIGHFSESRFDGACV